MLRFFLPSGTASRKPNDGQQRWAGGGGLVLDKNAPVCFT